MLLLFLEEPLPSLLTLVIAFLPTIAGTSGGFSMLVLFLLPFSRSRMLTLLNRCLLRGSADTGKKGCLHGRTRRLSRIDMFLLSAGNSHLACQRGKRIEIKRKKSEKVQI